MKKCKGNDKVDKFEGCGKPSENRTYGLCPKCLYKWSTETEKGKAWFKKRTSWKMKKNEKESKKEQRKKDREMKIQLMSTSEYWAKIFQKRFNEIIRIIDNGNGCICTNSTLGKQNAGHYFSVGSNKSLSLNLHNVHIQSEHSNSYKGGEPLKYRDGIKRVFGENYLNFMDSLKKCPSLNITKIELIEAYDLLLETRRNLLANELYLLSPLERIELRNEINEILEFYPKEFSVYDPNKIY